MNSLVSIAMCTYNGEKFIKEQLDSILNQTYQNLEIIITDDSSTDNTVKIIQEYQKKDTRIVLHQNEQNLGFIKNFEKSISLCNGEYIALADQDDIWKTQKIELFLKEIKTNVLIYSDAIIIDKNSNEVGHELIRPGRSLIDGTCNKALFLTNVISGNTLMFKTILRKHILPIPKDISYHDIWIGFVASTYGSITYTQNSMTYYRRYSEQVTNVNKATHKSFLDKLQYKKNRWIELVEERKKDLEIFRTLPILKDKNTIYILESLIEHLNNYKNIYFNFKIYRIFKENLEDIFAGFRPKKRAKKAFRNAIGLKLRVATLFIL
jgi:glycosyltransferase involved in cell wall biosynthesis